MLATSARQRHLEQPGLLSEPMPIMATSTVPSGGKFVKFFTASVHARCTPARSNRLTAVTDETVARMH